MLYYVGPFGPLLKQTLTLEYLESNCPWAYSKLIQFALTHPLCMHMCPYPSVECPWTWRIMEAQRETLLNRVTTGCCFEALMSSLAQMRLV